MSSPTQATRTHPDDTEFHREILNELLKVGQDLVRQLQKAATNGDLPLDQATIAFDRTARALRRTVALARTLGTAPGPQPHRTAARKRILRTVEDAINRIARPEDTATGLHAELRERLDAPDLEDEIGDRPVEDIIADILRDLGLATVPGFPNPWTRRTPADLRTLNARAATPPNPVGRVSEAQPATPRTGGAAPGTGPVFHAPHPTTRPPPTRTP